ncbi:phospholipid-transporting ATPase ID-like isoform X2 [Amphibalanus amphitrite]|uniref:phospholipid-transporting ATPase ID-like isoform X2 n=1 Tax=Amphibalanus amphitrite TaxID=1232801 RepID=UPI001C90B287|nr:phospholipid-transporting ATPase ID-like isoform X2 [Amphibalanus amphitrite]
MAAGTAAADDGDDMETSGSPASGQSSPAEGNGETIEMCRRGSEDPEVAEVLTRQPATAKERLVAGARRVFRLKEPPPPETERRIRANDLEYNSQFQYANNFIKTYKYTVLTFWPLNLFEQFQRLANFYFACLLVLQLIGPISSLTPITTLLPLLGVLSVTAAKDAYDDYQRHRNDRQVNNRVSLVLRHGKLTREQWSNVRVGDVIRMENDQFVAADLLLLSTSEPNGLSYIETAELDGETNLKCRQALPATAELGQDETLLGKFDGKINCEPPNNNLNKFEGTLEWNGKKFALDNDKILLRGCVLRNTQWCYGVVIFAGRDTKLMQNSGKTKFKRTSIDRLLNVIILGIVGFLLLMCLFCTIACGIWETVTGQYFRVYLPWDALAPEGATAGATVTALLVFFSYAIVLNTVVPISLYVSVEVIRLMQSFLINWDLAMYHEKSDTPAKARTTTLNEELGQVQYIFSDKTGTLTQNIMVFNKCSIAGKNYGDFIDPVIGEVIEPTEDTQAVDFSANDMYEPSFRFFDQTLLDAVNSGDEDSHMFFRLLSLCHTVMPEEKDGKLKYQAQSPDEDALVSAARNFGFVFLSRTPSSITIRTPRGEEEHEVLCILDFNNVRKRMSVILRHGGKIRLYCKGADNIVFERLGNVEPETKARTEEHLQKFAGEGLRTLVLAYKELDDAYFEEWKKRHHEASVSLVERDEKLDALFEEIEKDLVLIGATAIEDKLQDGVPQTIANLILAGIRLWVLTGDKQETAINIGYSCQLLTDDLQDVFVVEGHTMQDVEAELNRCMDDLSRPSADAKAHQHKQSLSVVTFSSVRSTASDEGYGHDTPEEDPTSNASGSGGFALVINGHSLIWALTSKLERLFLDVACQCQAVICCRVTPLQKALVVDLVKKHKKAVTLSIGDGANDVSMIKTAHIGVGISGQEGLQAVLSSDYSIAQFRYLERLLLVHGRWSYYRMCKFLRYFFYKNFAFTLCHFWYSFFCGFSAQTVFDPMFIAVYNLFYTSMPVLALAVFDQDVKERQSLTYPKLYTPGLRDLFFNKIEFFKSATYGFVTSLVLFIVPYGTYKDAVSPEGYTISDHQLFGAVVATVLVVVVTMQICLDTTYWTWLNHLCVWGSLFTYILLQFFYNYVLGGVYVGSLAMAMSEANFWFCTLLTVIVLMVPVLAWRFYFVDLHPTLADLVRAKQREDKAQKRRMDEFQRTPSARRRGRSVRSGYAFAHQEGFGRLITSGKMMRRPPPLASLSMFSLGRSGASSPRADTQVTFCAEPSSVSMGGGHGDR